MTNLTEDQVAFWLPLLSDYQNDHDYLARHKERDNRRRRAQREMFDVLNRYLSGETHTEQFRQTFDSKTKNEWDSFGIKGLSGGMFLNKLVKHIPDANMLSKRLRAVLKAPQDVDEGFQCMSG